MHPIEPTYRERWSGLRHKGAEKWKRRRDVDPTGVSAREVLDG